MTDDQTVKYLRKVVGSEYNVKSRTRELVQGKRFYLTITRLDRVQSTRQWSLEVLDSARDLWPEAVITSYGYMKVTIATTRNY